MWIREKLPECGCWCKLDEPRGIWLAVILWVSGGNCIRIRKHWKVREQQGERASCSFFFLSPAYSLSCTSASSFFFFFSFLLLLACFLLLLLLQYIPLRPACQSIVWCLRGIFRSDGWIRLRPKKQKKNEITNESWWRHKKRIRHMMTSSLGSNTRSDKAKDSSAPFLSSLMTSRWRHDDVIPMQSGNTVNARATSTKRMAQPMSAGFHCWCVESNSARPNKGKVEKFLQKAKKKFEKAAKYGKRVTEKTKKV